MSSDVKRPAFVMISTGKVLPAQLPAWLMGHVDLLQQVRQMVLDTERALSVVREAACSLIDKVERSNSIIGVFMDEARPRMSRLVDHFIEHRNELPGDMAYAMGVDLTAVHISVSNLAFRGRYMTILMGCVNEGKGEVAYEMVSEACPQQGATLDWLATHIIGVKPETGDAVIEA